MKESVGLRLVRSVVTVAIVLAVFVSGLALLMASMPKAKVRLHAFPS